MSRRVRAALLLLLGVFVFGTVGYVLIEGASWWDAFYMTAVTLTTVGYREVFPLSRAGEAFTVALLLGGIGLLFFLLTELGRSVVSGELASALGRVRSTRMLERMSGHEVVCGWGRMGQAVVEELRRGGHPFAVIERNPEKVRRLRDLGIPVVDADATSEEALRTAHVERARGLVACLNDDAHNVYVTLTARSLNPDLFIVARVAEPGADDRLRQAGANRVVNPYRLGGTRLAHLLVKPAVVDFLDVSFSSGNVELDIEQVALRAGDSLTGVSLERAELRRRFGIAVVAVKRGPALIPNPESAFVFQPEDVLVVLGRRDQVDAFDRSLSPDRSGSRRSEKP